MTTRDTLNVLEESQIFDEHFKIQDNETARKREQFQRMAELIEAAGIGIDVDQLVKEVSFVSINGKVQVRSTFPGGNYVIDASLDVNESKIKAYVDSDHRAWNVVDSTKAALTVLLVAAFTADADFLDMSDKNENSRTIELIRAAKALLRD